jgi:hypothetical protein
MAHARSAGTSGLATREHRDERTARVEAACPRQQALMLAERPARSQLPEELAVHPFLCLDDRLLTEDQQAEDVGSGLQVPHVWCAEQRVSLEHKCSKPRPTGSERGRVESVASPGSRRVRPCPSMSARASLRGPPRRRPTGGVST